MSIPPGAGLGWRPETAWLIDRRGVPFTEVVAENVDPARVPASLRRLLDRGVPVIPHGVSLSLGGAEPLDTKRVDHLARLAEALGAPLASEHVAFVRAGGLDSGHLLPVPRTEAMLEVLVDNVARARAILGVPLALENIAALFEWPGSTMDEPTFLSRLAEETGCPLLLDVSNLYANALNAGEDPQASLRAFPKRDIAYVHCAGGTLRGKLYHDTHAHALPSGALDLLASLAAERGALPVLLERDRHFDDRPALEAELDAIAATMELHHVA